MNILSSKTRRFAIVTALALAVCAVPRVASASYNNVTTTTSVHVPVADLNLTNTVGVDALYRRLSAASRLVCGKARDLKTAGSLKQLQLGKTCFNTTMAQALAEANVPSLMQANRS